MPYCYIELWYFKVTKVDVCGSLVLSNSVTYYGVRIQHAETRGVWGHSPPGNFLKIDAKRLNLVAFQEIKITIV